MVIYEGYRSTAEDGETPQLIVRDCEFAKNTDCGLGGYSELFQSQLPIFRGKFVSSAAGGLSILQTQPDFSINATITNTNFNDNNARFGSGMHIAIFEGVTNSTISISDCVFVSNGWCCLVDCSLAIQCTQADVALILRRRLEPQAVAQLSGPVPEHLTSTSCIEMATFLVAVQSSGVREDQVVFVEWKDLQQPN